MLLACSHLVIAAEDVERQVLFFRTLFGIEPYFANKEFAEFVLPSRFRVAFFRVVGPASKFFVAQKERQQVAFGLTVRGVDAIYAKAVAPELQALGVTTGGAPKEHPWGEKSFLLIDPEDNRWELAESPSEDGMLKNHEPK